MLNYFIAMDYKSKDNIKNYVYYLEKSAKSENIYPDSALELANHNMSNAELAISYTSFMRSICHLKELWHLIR